MSGQQIGKRFLKIMSSNLLGWVCLTGSCWAQKPTCQGQPPVKENLTCVEAESDQTSTDQPTTGGAALLLPQDKPQPESSTIENWFKPVFELSTEPPSLETVSEGATTEEVNLVPWRLGGGYNSSRAGAFGFWQLDTFLPFWQTPGEGLAFLDGRLLIYDGGDFGGNVALGYRSYLEDSALLLGGYVSYDNRDAFARTFEQIGLGFEALGEIWEGRINGYIPVGARRQEIGVTATSSPLFRRHYLVLERQRFWVSALGGFEAEAGGRIAQFEGGAEIRGYGGLYYLTGEGAPETVGWKLRLALRQQNNFNLSLGVQDDGRFGTNVLVNVGLSFAPLRLGKPTGTGPTQDKDWQVSQLGRSLERNGAVVLDQQVEREEVPLTNPATGESWFFQQVDLGKTGGDGTSESPFGEVEEAMAAIERGESSEGNTIVYVQSGTDPGIPAFTIPDGVQVLSAGPVQQLETSQRGLVKLPFSGSGNYPTVTDTITMGNQTTLSGFEINAPTGIRGTDVQNLAILNNRITGVGEGGGSGIELSQVRERIEIRENTITNSGRHGISIEVEWDRNQMNNIEGNTIRNSGENGIDILVEEESFQINIIRGNTISDSGNIGVAMEASPSASLSRQRNIIQNNTVINSSRFGIVTISIFEDSSQTNIIQNNTVLNSGLSGLQNDLVFASFQTNIIENNTVTNSGLYGLENNAVFRGYQTNSIQNNTVTNSGSSGIYNSVSDISSLCLNLMNNISDGQVGYEFNNSSFGRFEVVDLPNVQAKNIGTFQFTPALSSFTNVSSCRRLP